jgi:hypothetical protein
MKLWEIKAQSLRLMFADTDIEFNEDEFENGTIYDNANTKEKLVRMEDSIRRAIDLFYQYNGEVTRVETKGILFENDVYKNVIDVSLITAFGYPTRIDINKNLNEYILGQENIGFNYDRVTKRIYFTDYDFTSFEDNITFTIYFKMQKLNVPSVVDELEYDLDTIHIPEEVQRQIPFYVKSELYEEDEASTAMKARNQYLEFLILNQRKNYSKVKTKVKKTFNWGGE